MADEWQPIIAGVAISDFKSFGSDPVRLGPLPKATVLIGPNNVGKSNVLRYLQRRSRQDLGGIRQIVGLGQGGRRPDEPGDRDDDDFSLTKPDLQHWHSEYALPLQPDDLLQSLVKKNSLPQAKVPVLRDLMLATLDRCGAGTGFWWVPVTVYRKEKQVRLPQSFLDEVAERVKGIPELHAPLQRTFGMGGIRRNTAKMMAELMESSAKIVSIPENDPLIIPAFRHIQADGSDYLSGGGFAKHLAQFHHPVLSNRDTYQPLWDSFVSFVRTVMTDPDASVDIGGDGEEVLVTLSGGKTYRIEDLGSGIEQVLLLAGSATLRAEPSLVLIEEPELHLHPSRVRQLVEHLVNDPSGNQYILTSHSPHILDVDDVAVFRVDLDGNDQSSITPVRTGHDRFDTVTLLGARASDLVQANAAILVEGPSDRIYLRWWLGLIDADLQEGVDFVIVPYGGTLIGSYALDTEQRSDEEAAGDPLGDALVSMRSLNRKIAWISDWDTPSDGVEPGDNWQGHRARLRDEFAGTDAYLWVTAGKTIENYVPPAVFTKTLQELRPRADVPEFTDDIAEKRTTLIEGHGLKVRLAEAIAKTDSDDSVLDVHDLRERVEGLSRWIRNSHR